MADTAKEPCKTAVLAGGTCPDCGWEAGKSIEPHAVALHGSHFTQADEATVAKSDKDQLAALLAENAALKAENAELKAFGKE